MENQLCTKYKIIPTVQNRFKEVQNIAGDGNNNIFLRHIKNYSYILPVNDYVSNKINRLGL